MIPIGSIDEKGFTMAAVIFILILLFVPVLLLSIIKGIFSSDELTAMCIRLQD
jgi:hypothetical protein